MRKLHAGRQGPQKRGSALLEMCNNPKRALPKTEQVHFELFPSGVTPRRFQTNAVSTSAGGGGFGWGGGSGVGGS